MRRDEEARLDIISSISDEYIDEVTGERINAVAKLARARAALFKKLGAIAACFAVLIPTAIIILLNVLGSDVPTYTGMTVSNTSPFSLESAYVSSGNLPAGPADGPKDKPIAEGVKDHFGASAGQLLYYANPGEDIYITVNIDNPKNYEILSFTLNGEKYSSYMFEEGSDMEHLVLKVNVGETSGLVSYTIDAIKYIDGEKIKDVRMNGERTVNIGVYNENQPTASLSNLSVKDGEVKFNVAASDSLGLISLVGGKLYAVIYDGERVVSSKEIGLGTTEVSFGELDGDTEYTVAAVALFDAYDGQGRVPHLLCSEAFMTSQSIRATSLTVNGNTVNFELSASNDTIEFTYLELWDSFGNKVFESATPVYRIEDIPGGKLTLMVHYNYKDFGTDRSGESKTEFFCAEGMLPVVGEIIFHYSNSIVSRPLTGSYTMHQATDLAATADDLSVYSITDGVVVSVTHYYYYAPENSPSTIIDGYIEILDKDGVYHLYKYVRDMPFAVGDEVKLGDKLGVLYTSGDMLDISNTLHYACYTLNGEARIYHCPAFDTPAKSEAERLEDVLRANPILKDGLTVNGDVGEIVTVRLNFNTVAGDEIVLLGQFDLPSYVSVVKIEDNVCDLICDFSKITESRTHFINVTVFFDYFDSSFEFALNLSLTELPPDGGDDGGDTPDAPETGGDTPDAPETGGDTPDAPETGGDTPGGGEEGEDGVITDIAKALDLYQRYKNVLPVSTS